MYNFTDGSICGTSQYTRCGPSILSTWWQDCWAQGGYLAELTSREEELAVNEVISHEDHFWLGLNDVAQEGGSRFRG